MERAWWAVLPRVGGGVGGKMLGLGGGDQIRRDHGVSGARQGLALESLMGLLGAQFNLHLGSTNAF